MTVPRLQTLWRLRALGEVPKAGPQTTYMVTGPRFTQERTQHRWSFPGEAPEERRQPCAWNCVTTPKSPLHPPEMPPLDSDPFEY